jgi:hypothetical protein
MAKRGLVLLILAAFGLGACGSSGGGSSTASFCNLVKKDNADLKNATNKDALAAVRDLEKNAPSAIKGDLKTLIDTIDSVTASSLPSAEDAKKVEAASKNIEKYVKDECKIDLS